MSKQVIALIVAGLALICVLCGVGAYLLGVNTLRGYIAQRLRWWSRVWERFGRVWKGVGVVGYAYTPSTSTIAAGAPTKRIMR